MKEKIKDIAKKILKLDYIPDDMSQVNCDQWDSLRHLNLVIELELEFGLSFEPEDIAEMVSLDAIELKIKDMAK